MPLERVDVETDAVRQDAPLPKTLPFRDAARNSILSPRRRFPKIVRAVQNGSNLSIARGF